MTPRNNSPIILTDTGEDYCEARGYVEAKVTVDEARRELSSLIHDDDGNNPAWPIGDATRVWLRMEPNADGSLGEERWNPAIPESEGSVEFYAFDATDTRTMTAAA